MLIQMNCASLISVAPVGPGKVSNVFGLIFWRRRYLSKYCVCRYLQTKHWKNIGSVLCGGGQQVTFLELYFPPTLTNLNHMQTHIHRYYLETRYGHNFTLTPQHLHTLKVSPAGFSCIDIDSDVNTDETGHTGDSINRKTHISRGPQLQAFPCFVCCTAK